MIPWRAGKRWTETQTDRQAGSRQRGGRQRFKENLSWGGEKLGVASGCEVGKSTTKGKGFK